MLMIAGKEVLLLLKNKFSQNYVINPFMDDKALLKCEDGSILSQFVQNGKWKIFGNFHLKIEN